MPQAYTREKKSYSDNFNNKNVKPHLYFYNSKKKKVV